MSLIWEYLFLACGICAGAASVLLWRRPRLVGSIFLATIAVAFADWGHLLLRDNRHDPSDAAWVTLFDSFLIIGIAWIPAVLLLRLPRFRVIAHIVGSALAVWWIFDHTPTHAITGGAGPHTSAVTVAFCVVSFAFLNWLVVLRPAASQRFALSQAQVRPIWIATGLVVASACTLLAHALITEPG